MLAQNGTHIATLRARGYAEDGPATRLALARLLGSADLQPPAMPPAAILIVRRLADPLPGRLAPHAGAARVSVAWEAAGRAALADLQRAAARPWLGPVPPGAQAVVFADAAELLAGLAADLSTGQAAPRWWWWAILAGLPQAPAEALTTALCREPEAVPAVFDHLLRHEQAVQVVRFLAPSQAASVLAALAAAYHLPPAAARPPQALEAVLPRAPAGPRAPDRLLAAATPAETPETVAPWQAWWPQTTETAGLPADNAVLLGTALGLVYAPSVVRSTRFQEQVAAWRAAVGGRHDAATTTNRPQPPTAALAPATRPTHAVESSPRHTGEPAGAPEHDAAAPAEGVHSALELDSKKPVPRIRVFDADATGTAATPRKVAAAQDDSPRPHERAAAPPQAPPERRRAASQAAPPSAAASSAGKRPEPAVDMLAPLEQTAPVTPEVLTSDLALHFEGGVETALAGALYLLNMLARLDIPACFGEAWAPDPRVGPWGILAAVARGLIDQAPGVFVDDPLWEALDALDAPAGRDTASNMRESAGAGGAHVFSTLCSKRSEHHGVCVSKSPYVRSRQDPHVGVLTPPKHEACIIWRYLGNIRPRSAQGDNNHAPDDPHARIRQGRAYRLPQDWPLLPASKAPHPAEQIFAWAQRRGRLRLWLPDGYLLAAVPLSGEDGEAAARGLLEKYVDVRAARLVEMPWRQAPTAELDGPLCQDISAAMRRWLRPLLPYLRHRLQAALGVDEDGLQETLLMHRGRLYISALHVDLVMGLGEVSLPVRLAGLDTDPGWLPDFGRVVRFHYE